MSPLSIYAVVLGTLATVFYGLSVWRPTFVRGLLEQFPRHVQGAWVLTLVNVVWVFFIVYHASLGRFESWKPSLFVVAPVLFLLVIFYFDELLASRMLGGLFLLLANPIMNAARWHPADARLVVTVLTYVFIIWGMVLMLAPYRFRQVTEWMYASPGRARGLSVVGLLIALLVLGLGVAVY